MRIHSFSNAAKDSDIVILLASEAYSILRYSIENKSLIAWNRPYVLLYYVIAVRLNFSSSANDEQQQ